MTLYTAANRKNPILAVPHRLLLTGWKDRLEALELRAIGVELDRLIRSRLGHEIRTASWLPARLSPYGRLSWDETPLMRIWEKACQGDAKQTCWCFGLLLWEHMIDRADAWRIERADLGEIPVAGTTYIRCRTRHDGAAPEPMIAALG
jgi:hypothetical protein